MRLIVGVIALSLATLTSIFAQEHTPLESISASYYSSDISRNIFVGFLYAICAFLLAYNGSSTCEMRLSKAAALAAIGVAMFPCECNINSNAVPYVHGISAAVMFIAVAIFCGIFYRKARSKEFFEAKVRSVIYAVCFIVISLSVFFLVIDFFAGGTIKTRVPRLTFYGETASLVSFGVAWLVASRVIPITTNVKERISLI